jgi:PAS domain S-box-containing protein
MARPAPAMTALRLLLIDDSDDDALLIASQFRRAGVEVSYERADTAAAVTAAVRGRPPDVVVCDYAMPSLHAEDALAILRDSGLDVPFILVSGQVGEETAAALMRAGAHDFVLKDRLTRLVPAAQRELREAAERGQRRIAEAALRDSEERFRLLAEHAKDIIFRYRIRPEPAVEYISPAVSTIVGCKPEDLYADPGLAFTLVDPTDRAAFRASWHSGEPEQLTVRWHRRDEQVAWTQQRITAIRDGAGELIAVEGILRDVTEQVLTEREKQRLERELALSERLDSLGQLAGGIAHDFNNLLAVISGYADIVAADTDPEDPRRADLESIRRAAQRAAALTRQLLIFSRREPSRPRTVNLNDVVTETTNLLARTLGEDIEVALDLHADLPPVLIDPTKLEQVLLNLVMNARAAMAHGGQLSITTRCQPHPTADGNPHSRPADPVVVLAVTDTGTGMPPEVASHAFEPFFTTKPPGQGTGLGLATAYGVIKEAGGDITIDSTVGHGTTVQVLLPATDQVETTSSAPAEPVVTGGGETILVIEDENAVREIVTRILTRNGYLVIATGTPTQAVALYQSHPHIAAVLTDVVMPAMSGTQVAAEIRQLNPNTPILFMSGYTTGPTPGGQAMPPDAPLIHKPFDAPTLLTRLAEVLPHHNHHTPG